MNGERGHWVWVVVAAVLALGLIISAQVFGSRLVEMKTANNVITVTGSAKQQIKSDQAVWTGSFAAQAAELSQAYDQLANSQKLVREYLINQGFGEKDIIFSSIHTETRNIMLPSGQYTNEIESYRLYQHVEIRSQDVDKITVLSREATELINQGVEFQSYPPQYFYTKMADLKIEMLALATKDARTRAEQIAENTNSKVGALRTAKMGVFQITPLYSNEISDYGINDTSSLVKEITAVMNCEVDIR